MQTDLEISDQRKSTNEKPFKTNQTNSNYLVF